MSAISESRLEQLQRRVEEVGQQIEELGRLLADKLTPTFDQLVKAASDFMVLYEEHRRLYLETLLSNYLPPKYASWLARRWPKRWLPDLAKKFDEYH